MPDGKEVNVRTLATLLLVCLVLGCSPQPRSAVLVHNEGPSDLRFDLIVPSTRAGLTVWGGFASPRTLLPARRVWSSSEAQTQWVHLGGGDVTLILFPDDEHVSTALGFRVKQAPRMTISVQLGAEQTDAIISAWEARGEPLRIESIGQSHVTSILAELGASRAH